MAWTVIGEKNGMIQLVSKGEIKGLLPKGAYLTIEDTKTKFILRVDNSQQNEPYSPSPMIVDMDLNTFKQDQKCQNIISAYRVKDISNRQDGLIDYIKPQLIARRSTQEEVDIALGNSKDGIKVFVATLYGGQNHLLVDENQNFITANLDKDMFFHQMLVCGKTGSGKTVATKYLAQHFVEKMGGAVLAINVKDVDFLKMDKKSDPKQESITKEWNTLNEKAHPISNFTVYYPAGTEIHSSKGVNPEICEGITLNVKEIDPDSMTGLIQGLTDLAAENLPNIFRWWQENQKEKKVDDDFKFAGFIDYFQKGINDKLNYRTKNIRGDNSELKIHRGTYESVLRKLNAVAHFFDNDAKSLDESDILIKGKMSVIDVTTKNGTVFGSVLLRNLLHRIVTAKSEQRYNVPILIIIDEVHMFYNTNAASEALGELDTISRTGRSTKIGVIFSSQNPADIPRGLSSVINTKIFFKTDHNQLRSFGITVSSQEIESLKKGYAVASIHEMSQLKIIKFPLSYAGVFEDKGDKDE
jgi:uncharacterized protein